MLATELTRSFVRDQVQSIIGMRNTWTVALLYAEFGENCSAPAEAKKIIIQGGPKPHGRANLQQSQATSSPTAAHESPAENTQHKRGAREKEEGEEDGEDYRYTPYGTSCCLPHCYSTLAGGVIGP